MVVEPCKWWSQHLDQEMEIKIYGHAGKPTLVFPTQGGCFYEFEDHGMLPACQPFLADGMIQLVTVNSIDRQSWANWEAPPAERARRHESFVRYIIHEVIPFIRQRIGDQTKLMVIGCAMGAYHATNFFFRYPNQFDALIALSGFLSLETFIGDYMDETVYYNSPLAYLPNLTDPLYLKAYNQSKIIVCAGQSDWDDPVLEDTRALQRILYEKKIPSWIDFWGTDVNHDWPWWRKMLPYFLEHLDLYG